MLEVVYWMFFGLLCGWIASLLSESNVRRRAGLDISGGVLGSILGGLAVLKLVDNRIDGFNENSLWGAITGALVMIAIVRLINR